MKDSYEQKFDSFCIFRTNSAYQIKHPVLCNSAEQFFHRCDTCGWNPEVEEKRKAELYRKAGRSNV